MTDTPTDVTSPGRMTRSRAITATHVQLFSLVAAGDADALRELIPPYPASSAVLRELVNARGATEKQDTLLTWAARHGHVSIVALLLERGADLHSTTGGHGASALHIACQEGHVACVAHLVGARADVNLTRDNGGTPLHASCLLGRVECVELLLGAGAGVDEAKDTGSTPLYLACQEGHHECVRLLVAAGASVNKARDNRTSPLRVCCQNGHVGCAKALIVAGANVNQAGESGGTPLHTACQVRRAPAALAVPSSVNPSSRTSLTPLASSPSLSAARPRRHPRPPPRRRR